MWDGKGIGGVGRKVDSQSWIPTLVSNSDLYRKKEIASWDTRLIFPAALRLLVLFKTSAWEQIQVSLDPPDKNITEVSAFL